MSHGRSNIMLAQRIAIEAMSPHASLADAIQAGKYILPQRDRCIEICIPYARALSDCLIRLPAGSRLEQDDIYGAAMVGLIEAVDSYEPWGDAAQPRSLQAHLRWGISKWARLEREKHHWVAVKPGREAARRYMSGKMQGDELEAYLDMFVRQHGPG